MDGVITISAKGGKIGGKVIGNVYVTTRKPFHVMRKTGGSFGISYDVLNKLRAFGVKYILFLYYGKRERCQFITTLERYFNPDDVYVDGVDKQHHVRIANMEKVNGLNWRATVRKLHQKYYKQVENVNYERFGLENHS